MTNTSNFSERTRVRRRWSVRNGVAVHAVSHAPLNMALYVWSQRVLGAKGSPCRHVAMNVV